MAGDDVQAMASVRCHLEKDGYRVFVTHSGSEALNLMRRRRPDVLVVDQAWLEAEGFGLGGASQRETPIIILTPEVGAEELEPNSESGMAYHIVKPVDPCDVLSRVRTALREVGKAIPEKPEELRCGDLVIDRRCHEVHVRGETVRLTPTEFKLVEVLAGDPGRAFTRLELLGRVFGHDYEGLERTVDSHVKNLRRKIEPDPMEPTYIETVYGVGYRFTGPRGVRGAT